jgi:AcrR family transcriptional regulator
MICQASMSPRPRTVPDADVLAAANRAIMRLGPARFTLADVAREAGLAPATLVQRFGSKRALLLALVEFAVAGVDACFAMMRATHRSPLAALIGAGTDMTRHVRSPEELANGLAFLQMDIADPAFRRVAVENARRIHAGYVALLDAAVAAGELRPCDTGRLARAASAISGGSLISWAILRDGAAERWVRHDLETLLEPYRRGRSTRRRAVTTGRSAGRVRRRARTRRPRR